jgi:hypothetical protein
MLTDDEIRSLIALKSEGPNLDYKAGFAWTKNNRDKKYELVRDLMALSNTKDGGRVIFGVRDDDLSFVGVSSDVYESADPSSVVQMLHDNGAPKVRCAVVKREISGKRVVVFDVAEFDETPTICTNTITSNDGAKRIILREGAVYVRTGAATTEEVSSADDMRALISRAVTRKSDELLRSMRELLTGKPVSVGADSANAFAEEIRQAKEFLVSKLGNMAELGYFEVAAHPTIHDPRRIRSLPEVQAILRASEVLFRGWDFPHTDKSNASPFGQGFQSVTIWERYVEGFRLYQSGLFLWRRAYWEDVENKRGNKGQRLLSFISTIYSFTEFFTFLSRLYERVAPDATVRVRVKMTGCKDRELASFDGMVSFFDGHISREDTIFQEREIQVVELRASHLDIAREAVKHVFHVFDWLDVTDTAIVQWQQKLIKRQF